MEQASLKDVSIKWGAIFGGASILFFYLMAITGNAGNQTLGWLGLIITIGALVLAMLEYRRINGGLMSFGRGVGLGVLVVLIGGVLYSIFDYIYINFIDPNYYQAIMETSIQGMEDRGMSEGQIEQATEAMQGFFKPWVTAIFSVGSTLFFGTVFSLIISAILQKKDKAGSGPGVY